MNRKEEPPHLNNTPGLSLEIGGGPLIIGMNYFVQRKGEIMNKKILTYAVIFTFSVFLVSAIVNQADGYVGDNRIIRIFGGYTQSEEKLRIEPETVLIAKGDVVVWLNWAKAREVKVVFEEGKVCEDVTEAALVFKLDPAKQCFVTSWIPLGGTSSLRFVQNGRYRYVVETSTGIKSSGMIQVGVKE